MQLHQLAGLILAITGQPIRRVRLAKAVYFTHKALIRHQLMQISDIKYIRLPLGPVPEGFLTLAADFPTIVAEKTDTIGDLYYESEFFSTVPEVPAFIATFDAKITDVIRQTLTLLNNFSTPELVKHSQDPSWLAHFNGEHYELTSLDLKNTFPILPKTQKLFHSAKKSTNPNLISKFTIKLPQTIRLQFKIRPTDGSNTTEIGKLQADLLRGMLHDIVKESTDLEYPDERQTSKQKANNSDRPNNSNNSDTPAPNRLDKNNRKGN